MDASQVTVQLMACVLGFPVVPGGTQEIRQAVVGALSRDYPQPVPSSTVGREGKRVFFTTRDGIWRVWLGLAEVGLETRACHDFAEVQQRIAALARSVEPVLRGDTYSRVGLRTLFSLPVLAQPSGHIVHQWVQEGVLPPVRYILSEIVNPAGEGACLDVDVFSENVATWALGKRLDQIYDAGRQLSDIAKARRTAVEPWRHIPEQVAVHDWAPAAPTTIAAYPEALPQEQKDVKALAAERAELLLRQFKGTSLAVHESNRLAAVTARLNELLPRVTVKDFEELETMALRVREIGQRTTERRKRLRRTGAR
jgi:hypothetical protein